MPLPERPTNSPRQRRRNQTTATNDDVRRQTLRTTRRRTLVGQPMKALAEQINDLNAVETYGRVVGVRGLMVEVAGPIHAMSVGSRLGLETAPGRTIPC